MTALRRFIVALLAITLAFGAYALLAAPWLEPPAIQEAEVKGSSEKSYTSTVELRDISSLFEENAWERDNPKVVETAQCTLLLKDYKPLADGRMELFPCTLIFYVEQSQAAGSQKPDGARRRPIVLRAPQGAILQFDKAIDFGRAEFGQLVGGQLKGNIEIYSPPSQPDGEDSLSLTTRNVQIEKEKVYTPHEVDFQYGKSSGRGRDLTLMLLPKEESDGRSQRAGSLSGLSYLQLSHVERLSLAEASGLLSGEKASQTAPEPSVEVRCRGPLVIDFERRQASLDDQVEITRAYPAGPPDRLTCDRLLFFLAKPARRNGGTKEPKQEPAASGKDSKLAQQIERIVAIGNPVVLEAPRFATFAKSARMEYVTATRLVRLNSGQTGAPVVLRREQSRIEARDVEYLMAEPGRLGQLVAAGPGELELAPKEGEQGETVRASWKKRLQIRPHEQNQVISLFEQAHVSVDESGEFSAQELHLWVLEAPQPMSQAKKPGWTIIPQRMLALTGVEIDSPQLKAKTSRLEAWFADPTAEQLAAARSQDPAKIKPLFPTPAGESKGSNDESGESSQKLDVAGDLIQMQFLRFGKRPVIEDLAITGHVQVEEVQTQKPDEIPLKLSGEAVTLVRGSSTSAKLEVQGRPAEVSARGLSLSGGKIHLHRGENRLWIDGPGEASLPLPQDGLRSRTLEPPPGELPVEFPAAGESRKIDLTWQRSMNFDGLRATFEGKVQARGDGELAQVEKLTATLSQRIDFAGPQPKEPVEIAGLVFDGGGQMVTIQQVTRDKEGNRTALDNIHVRKLTIDRQAGTLQAEGPGEVWTVRRDTAGLAGPIPLPMPAREPDGKLTYVCIKFEGEIVGNLDKHQVRFERQVETTYGRVEGWEDRIIATRLEDLGETGALVHSDTLQVTEMILSKAQKWVELEARGNTLVEGKIFTARAARIGYTSDKDQLVLEGDGRNLAELWHQSSPGAQHSYTKAGKIRYQRKSNTLEVDDAQILDLSTLPASSKPLPVRRR